jgi:hypothetical protein
LTGARSSGVNQQVIRQFWIIYKVGDGLHKDNEPLIATVLIKYQRYQTNSHAIHCKSNAYDLLHWKMDNLWRFITVCVCVCVVRSTTAGFDQGYNRYGQCFLDYSKGLDSDQSIAESKLVLFACQEFSAFCCLLSIWTFDQRSVKLRQLRRRLHHVDVVNSRSGAVRVHPTIPHTALN